MQFICLTLRLTSTGCAFTNVNAACALSQWQFVLRLSSLWLVSPATGWGVRGGENRVGKGHVFQEIQIDKVWFEIFKKGKRLVFFFFSASVWRTFDLKYLKRANDWWFLCIRLAKVVGMHTVVPSSQTIPSVYTSGSSKSEVAVFAVTWHQRPFSNLSTI